MNECPICNTPNQQIESDNAHHSFYVDCIVCGNYNISELALSMIDDAVGGDDHKRRILSYAIRQLQEYTECPKISSNHFEELLKTELPTIDEQKQNLMLLIRENVNEPGELYPIDSREHIARVGAVTASALEQLINHLLREGMIEGNLSRSVGSNVHGRFNLTVEGWQECESIISGISKLKRAFMAMDFKNPDVDKVYTEVYKPLCEELGYYLSTVSNRAGIIDLNIRNDIEGSKFIIADLTDDNYGAYWESGFAEGKGIPVIYCCELTKFEEKSTHFDTEHLLTARWSLDDIEFTTEELRKIIVDTFPS